VIVSCIVAMSENRVIGAGGRLPWRLPADLARFKQTTLGHFVIMGRKTWESIGRPLPQRTNVVITRRSDYPVPSGVEVVHSLTEALELAEGQEEVFVIGGGEVFEMALPRCDRVYMTVVHTVLDGDAFFPEATPNEWQLVAEEAHPADERHEHAHTFRVYERSSA
jgi:dihydrofolate reductase